MGKWDEGAQANWQAQFDYQQAQDALDRQQWQTQWDASRQADRQSTAYKMATAMLENGLMPDTGTLAAAGISQADAQALVGLYAAQNFMAGSSGGTSSRSSGGSRSGGSYDNGSLTSSQVKELQKYYGVAADGLWGTSSRSAAGGLGANEAWSAYPGAVSVSPPAGASSLRTSFDYSPDEGIFRYAGNNYNTADGLLNAISAANLTTAEQEILKKKMAYAGMDIEF